MAEKGEFGVARVESETSSPLGEALGLSDAELDLCGRFFALTTEEAGLNGAEIFQKLREGKSLAEAMSVSHRVIEALYARGRQWIAVGRFDRAEQLFRALVLLDPGSADYRVAYGACLKQRDRCDEAAQAFSEAAAIRPDWAIPHFHLLGISIRRGDWAGARRDIAAFDAAATVDIQEAVLTEAARIRAALAARTAEWEASS